MNELRKSPVFSLVGKNIKNLRERRKWKQKDMANKLGISIAAFSKMETGFTDINLSRLWQIAEVFDISVAAIVSVDYGETLTVERPPVNPAEERLVKALRKRVTELELEALDLMRKIIELHEELRMMKEAKNTAGTMPG